MIRIPLALLFLAVAVSAARAEEKERPRTPDVRFIPTPPDVVEKMLELASVTNSDVVADLGCGDGRFVITAAKKYGCKAVGYDLDPKCVRLSLEGVKRAGVEKLVRIENADILTVDLKEVTVVTLFLGPALNAKLAPQLSSMKPGSRVVSHGFPIPGFVPDKVVEFTSQDDNISRKLYLCILPLKKARAKE